jgi:predicted MPP superfamily phosphohydrolase
MRRSFRYVFLIITLSILTGAIVYLSKRFQFFFSINSLGWLIVFFSLVLNGMMVGLFMLSNSKTIIMSLLYKLSALMIAFMLYLLPSVIAVDLLNLLLPVKPLVMGLVSMGLAILVVLIGFIRSYQIKTSKHNFAIPGLQKSLKIAHWTDIHLGHFRGRKFLQQLVDKTIRQSPDLVVITGDLYDGKIQLSTDVLTPLKQLNVPIYFVHGNHDVYSGLKEVFEVVNKSGVKILQNERIVFEGLQIIGLNHMRADDSTGGMHASGGPNTIQDVLNKIEIDREQPGLLLHHSPDGIEYAQDHGIDLYLSGHTHGGQQFPVTLINELLFRFNRGLHDYKGTKILVSEGVGTFGPPVRVGTKSELLLIELVPLRQ